MSQRKVLAYEFVEKAFLVGSAPVTCVVPLADLRRYLTVAELNFAFSGYVRYHQISWIGRYLGVWSQVVLGLGGKKFIGVWGKRNCQRLRRFLRERGAEVEARDERPVDLRFVFRTTKGKRRKLRSLEAA